MACEGSRSDPMPSYWEVIDGIVNFTVNTVDRNYLSDRELTPEEKSWYYFNFTTTDIAWVFLAATFFTVLRHYATDWVFIPLAKTCVLTSANQRKMPESAWKFIFYLFIWIYSLYILILSGHYCFFQRPSIVWDGWSLSKNVPSDIYVLYVIQTGFYLHSVYATLFLDVWRKDSVVMMVHHVLTMTLTSFSYSLRYHNIGSVVTFLHDGCDILLEFTKLNVYFKTQNGKTIKAHEFLANLTFFLFAASWFVCRLYWYPLKVLYSTTSVVSEKELILPCAILMNVLLWVLQILNIYWFMFIVGLLVRVVTGQMSDVEDTREFDVEENFSQKLSEKLNSIYDERSSSSSSHAKENHVKIHKSCENSVSNGDNGKQTHLRKMQNEKKNL